jgi:hypothetical protein
LPELATFRNCASNVPNLEKHFLAGNGNAVLAASKAAVLTPAAKIVHVFEKPIQSVLLQRVSVMREFVHTR